ncbi:MAG: hypothetical protein GY856_39635 [bacterium]|nr:hypothetical protein [bacterium]
MMLSRLQFYWVVAVSGGVLMALEIVSSRVLAPQFGASVYVWGSIIGVFLAAMSIGYAWGGRLADRQPHLAKLGQLLLGAALAEMIVLGAGTRVVTWLGELTRGSPFGILLVTAVLFGPATMLLATVSPFAVKLATRDLKLLGGTAGRLYALATAGSLVGTLAATFGLIPYLSIEAILRVLIVLTILTATAALASSRQRDRLAIALALSLLVLVLAPQVLRGGGTGTLVADRMTPYQTLRVYERGGVRFLRSDGTLHAAVVLESGEPWVLYARVAPAALLLHPEIESLLALGMGGGSVGSYLRQRLPELRVDYVEIDPVVPELARQHLLFDDDDFSQVHIDDARRFLTGSERTWDYIYCDTYIGDSVPFHLSTREFFREVKRHLNPEGVFGINLIDGPDSPFGKAMLCTVRTTFPQTYLFDVRGGNYLLLATDRSATVGSDELPAIATQLDTRWSFDPSLVQMVEGFHEAEVDLSDAQILTDGYAPVNHLIRLRGDEDRPSASPPPRDEASRSSIALEFLAEYEVPSGTRFEETCVGGLSALAYDAERNLYFALSDAGNDPRFYTLRIAIGLDAEDRPVIRDVAFENVIRLRTREGSPYAADRVDPEGFVLPGPNTALVSSEGVAPKGVPPFVDVVEIATGTWLGTIPIPPAYRPRHDGSTQVQGVRRNLGFEALALSPDRRQLFVASESALAQDTGGGVRAGATLYARLLHFQLAKVPQLVGETLYPLRHPEGDVLVHGLVELLALDNAGRFLALERTFGHDLGMVLRLFEIRLDETAPQADRSHLSPQARKLPVLIKRPLELDFSRLGIELDNFEGLALGPRLADGGESLLIVGDNDNTECHPPGDEKPRPTKFLLFELYR